jgi:two-component system, response regulator YesN
MLTVLIVDDEYIVLKGIEVMLTKQTQVELRVYTATDSIKALEELPKLRPDVVVADINMPELDGLSMIEKAMDQGYTGKFIIVSGYEKIEYFKRAIQCQVIDYLLKPINKEKLISTLQGIDYLKTQLQETILFKLKMCMLQNEHKKDVSFTNTDIRNLLYQKYLTLCVLPCIDIEQVLQIKRNLSNYIEQIYSFVHGNQTIFFLNFSVKLEEKELHQLWNQCLPNLSFNSGISNIQSVEQFIEDINVKFKSTLYTQAMTEMILSFLPLEPKEVEVVRENIQYETMAFHTILSAILYDASFQMFFDNLFQNTSSINIAHIKAFLEIAVYNVAIFGMDINHQMIIKTYEYQCQHISDYHSFRHLLKEMLTNFWCLGTVSNNNESDYSEKIQQAILYIKQHYKEDVSLDCLAQQINLNPCYLSNIFKKDVGMTFLQYLQKTRLDRACTLLKSSPNLSIETISSQVGYQTPTYFFKIFREQFGISPSQWRCQEINQS